MKMRVKAVLAALAITTLVSVPSAPPARAADLFAFSSLTFTNCTKTGNLGPSLAQCKGVATYLAQSWTTDTSFFNVLNGIQYWTVPKTGVYRITAAGASGGQVSGMIAGSGSTMRGDFLLIQGSVIAILVGQVGLVSNSAGGGGGSFVVGVSAQGDTSTAGVMLVAGGGGGSASGGGSYSFSTIAESATITNASNVGGCASLWADCINMGYLLSNSASGGNGGGKGFYLTNQGAGGGGGLLTNGGSNPSGYADGGKAFFNGGAGAGVPSTRAGGFGGGGAGEYVSYSGSGGGGGYSGGGGGVGFGPGGGGGSFNNGMSQANVAGNNVGAGSVTISFSYEALPAGISWTTLPTSAVFRGANTITATTTVAGSITFYANGKVIPGCKNLKNNSVTGAAIDCSWKPSVHGGQLLSATLISSGVTYTTGLRSIGVARRTGNR